MSKFPSIPTPNPDFNSILATLNACKQCLDILTGATGMPLNGALFASSPTLYVSNTAPAVGNVSQGDFWFNPLTKTLSICMPGQLNAAFTPNVVTGALGWVQVAAAAPQPVTTQQWVVHGGGN